VLDCVGRDRRAPRSRGRRLESGFPSNGQSCRPGADPRAIADWEERHGYHLPHAFRRGSGSRTGSSAAPLYPPITAIGPMIPFARVPQMLVQPESWFELGNPSLQTICIDLAYRLPAGGFPIFTSGDDESGIPLASLQEALKNGFWSCCGGGPGILLEPGFRDFGDPWESHRRYVSQPALSSRLLSFADGVARLQSEGVDERKIAGSLGLSLAEVESIFRYLQHSFAGQV